VRTSYDSATVKCTTGHHLFIEGLIIGNAILYAMSLCLVKVMRIIVSNYTTQIVQIRSYYSIHIFLAADHTSLNNYQVDMFRVYQRLCIIYNMSRVTNFKIRLLIVE